MTHKFVAQRYIYPWEYIFGGSMPRLRVKPRLDVTAGSLPIDVLVDVKVFDANRNLVWSDVIRDVLQQLGSKEYVSLTGDLASGDYDIQVVAELSNIAGRVPLIQYGRWRIGVEVPPELWQEIQKRVQACRDVGGYLCGRVCKVCPSGYYMWVDANNLDRCTCAIPRITPPPTIPMVSALVPWDQLLASTRPGEVYLYQLPDPTKLCVMGDITLLQAVCAPDQWVFIGQRCDPNAFESWKQVSCPGLPTVYCCSPIPPPPATPPREWGEWA
jgi:hypothetical protein